MPNCILVIPCYNEAKRLDLPVFNAFLEQRADIKLLFVNDGSTDQTLQILEDFCARWPDRVSVLNLCPNGGKAKAVVAGMQQVFSQAEFVGYWDADLSTPLSELDLFVQEFERFPSLQIVIGSRVKIMGRRIIRKRSRHYVGRVFATLVSILLKTPFYDTQCGAKLFRSTPLIQELFVAPFTTKWIFDVELLQRFTNHPQVRPVSDISTLIHEVALNNWEDVAGSKLKAHDFAIAFIDLLRLYFKGSKSVPSSSQDNASH
jgi:glycosyltransferase involved in cell wall biosynthesis